MLFALSSESQKKGCSLGIQDCFFFLIRGSVRLRTEHIYFLDRLLEEFGGDKFSLLTLFVRKC